MNISPSLYNAVNYIGTRTTIKPYTYYYPPNEQEYNNIVYNIPYSSQDNRYNYDQYSNSSFIGKTSTKYNTEKQSSLYTNLVTNETLNYNKNYFDQQDRSDLQQFYSNGKIYHDERDSLKSFSLNNTFIIFYGN